MLSGGAIQGFAAIGRMASSVPDARTRDMDSNLVGGCDIHDFLDRIAGLHIGGGDARAKQILHRV